MRRTNPSLIEDYDHYPRIEAEFQSALDESLNSRGPELLYEIVRNLGLPPKADALDLGCGEGRFSIELAKRFGFLVTGVDPVPRNIEVANHALNDATKRGPGLADLVHFQLGAAETLPLGDSSIDLIWCREVLALVEDLASAFAECRRVLCPEGRMLIYQNCRTDRLEPRKPSCLERREDSTHAIWKQPLERPVSKPSNSWIWAARSASISRNRLARQAGACATPLGCYATRSATSLSSARPPTTSCSATVCGTSTA